ncbi:MAG: DUF3422 domain-containing protein [Rhodobacteraceae bacterium]|jgi:uncharacterized membrane-anchored protein|nr:DUF3422 domain-containing protein [Paracoccaceae bacterium]
MPLIQDHPMRYKLANELHARPFPSFSAPGTVAYLAIKQPQHAVSRDRERERLDLIALLDRFGTPHPQPGATHFFGDLGRHKLKWEQHTEFVTYTLFSNELSERAFDATVFEAFPKDWLAQLEGVCITSASIRIERRSADEDIAQHLRDWFVPESLAVSYVLDNAAIVAADFRIDELGHHRIAMFVDPSTGERRIGRIIQRLCEIETYKTMSMLGFSRARSMQARMSEIDAQLSDLMVKMSNADIPAEGTLNSFLHVSAELENMSAQSAFRFGATWAYQAILNQRIEVLREERFMGRQTFYEFMMRRYDPAMRTVKSTETRLSAMADRAMRAGELLRTKVDVERSAQNQAVLKSMDQRADLQLRLQKTVEGLSVVAISYYAVSLVGYVIYPLADMFQVTKGMLTAAITLPVVLAVWYLVRRIRAKME